jgi:hypothetical protein
MQRFTCTLHRDTMDRWRNPQLSLSQATIKPHRLQGTIDNSTIDFVSVAVNVAAPFDIDKLE